MSITDQDRMAILEQRMNENVAQRDALVEDWVRLYEEWYTLWAKRDQEMMEAWT